MSRLLRVTGKAGSMGSSVGLVRRNALLGTSAARGPCFSPRRLEAAPDGEEQTQNEFRKRPQITRSRTIEICGLEQYIGNLRSDGRSGV